MKHMSLVKTTTFFAVIIIPLAIIIQLYFVIKPKNEFIDFAKYELYGNEYIRPVQQLFAQIIQHRDLCNQLLTGNTNVKAQLSMLQGEIDSSFISFESINSKFGTSLQFTDEGLRKRNRDDIKLQLVRNRWSMLKANYASMKPEEISDKHIELIGNFRTIITHAGDTSNLILDPDLDSYYLMDVTLLAMPQMEDRLQEIQNFLHPILAAKKIPTNEEKLKVAIYARFLKEADLERVKASAQTALREDENFYEASKTLQKNLPEAQKKLNQDVQTVILLLERISVGEVITINEFTTAINSAINQNFAYWNVAVDELDILLRNRVSSISDGKNFAVGVVCGVWLLMILAMFYAGKNVIQRLKVITNNLVTEATRAGFASEHLSELAQTVSSSSNEQLTTSSEVEVGIHKTMEAVSEMTGMMVETSRHMGDALSLAGKVSEQTQQGEKVIESLAESMESMRKAGDQLTGLLTIIEDISAKTEVINDIVLKTQVLSFNASIEAARVGQHGRGFAVVAEEVGNLAQLTGNAAKEISLLLVSSKKQVAHVVENTIVRLKEGLSISKQAVETFNEIAQNSGEITTKIGGIGEASREQEMGIKQVSESMQDISQVIRQNGSAADKATKASHSLYKQSEQLKEQSEKLKKISDVLIKMIFGNSIANSPRKNIDNFENEFEDKKPPLIQNKEKNCSKINEEKEENIRNNNSDEISENTSTQDIITQISEKASGLNSSI